MWRPSAIVRESHLQLDHMCVAFLVVLLVLRVIIVVAGLVVSAAGVSLQGVDPLRQLLHGVEHLDVVELDALQSLYELIAGGRCRLGLGDSIPGDLLRAADRAASEMRTEKPWKQGKVDRTRQHASNQTPCGAQSYKFV